MLVLLALYTFVAFVGEMEKVGTGRYNLLGAIQYVLYTLPKRVYELFPITALLGTLVGLGGLAAGSELTAIRAAGVSVVRIGGSVMRVAAILMLVVAVVGELVAPELEQYAIQERAIALGQQSAMQGKSGFWARDGDSFINIRSIHPGGRLTDVTLYQLDKNHQLKMETHAAMASYYDGSWQLAGITRRTLTAEGMSIEQMDQARWDSLLSPTLLEVVMVRPDALSISGLYQYLQYLHDNHLDASRYEQAFWEKLVDPFSTGVMVLFALPFLLGSLRSVSLSQRVVTGTLVGITFHIINRAFHYIGQIYGLPPMFSTIFPTAAFFSASMFWLRKVR